MAKVSREERLAIGRTRILSVLRTHTVANQRTLEQKIADAGPNPQRVQPHILTDSKRELLEARHLVAERRDRCDWFFLPDADPKIVAEKLERNHELWTRFTDSHVVRRTGQALELAIYRAILENLDKMTPYGGFTDLNAHEDDRLFAKEEIRNFNGRTIGNRALDFLVRVGSDHVGIEAKNIRPWLYPHEREIRDAVAKALTLGVIPVLIGRRIPFVTLRVLGACGVILHETYNQRMANADAELATAVRHKDALGYHDIRTGNEPDARLLRFIGEHLPDLVEPARGRLEAFEDLLSAWATREMAYKEFAARVRRRQLGVNEDTDEPDDQTFIDPDPYDY